MKKNVKDEQINTKLAQSSRVRMYEEEKARKN